MSRAAPLYAGAGAELRLGRNWGRICGVALHWGLALLWCGWLRGRYRNARVNEKSPETLLGKFLASRSVCLVSKTRMSHAQIHPQNSLHWFAHSMHVSHLQTKASQPTAHIDARWRQSSFYFI